MKEAFLETLACISCRGEDLRLEIEEQEADGEIITGKVICSTCGAEFPITRGVMRTVESDDYVGNFSFEWQLHRKTQIDTETDDSSYRAFKSRIEVDPADLADLKVLDVGVGTGRFADPVSRGGAHVTGIDLSLAVETAMENVGRRPHTNIIQANCFDLPFRKESFDFIYSIGVLHHTPDCKQAFLSLLPYMKPGGTIAIWVYNAHVWSPGSVLESVNRIYRSVTTRLPPYLLYALCLCELPLYYLRKIPGFDQMLHLLLPGILYHAIPKTNDSTKVREHILDTFDWYSPKYQSKHTIMEVFDWFEKAGLTNIRVIQEPVALSGRKPELDERPEVAVRDESAETALSS